MNDDLENRSETGQCPDRAGLDESTANAPAEAPDQAAEALRAAILASIQSQLAACRPQAEHSQPPDLIVTESDSTVGIKPEPGPLRVIARACPHDIAKSCAVLGAGKNVSGKRTR